MRKFLLAVLLAGCAEVSTTRYYCETRQSGLFLSYAHTAYSNGQQMVSAFVYSDPGVDQQPPPGAEIGYGTSLSPTNSDGTTTARFGGKDYVFVAGPADTASVSTAGFSYSFTVSDCQPLTWP